MVIAKAKSILTGILLLLLTQLLTGQPVGYYNGTDGKSGDELKTTLNEIISNHIDFSYGFSRDIINYADADPTNPENVILFYLQESRDADNYGTGGDYINREHVWAKSHGNFSGIRPMDSDAHNLHAADASVNEDRSNKDFDNIQPNGHQHPEALSCYYTDSTWEPGPATKGQVARTLFYMATRYEGGDGTPDLELVNHNNTYPAPLHGNLDALLEWNRNYPPSALERRRNERVFESQQNRNPFVDHPEFADFIWGNQNPSGIQFSEFKMNPEFPSIGEEINIRISTVGNEVPSNVTLFWGKEFNSEGNKLSMQSEGNTYALSILPSGFQPGEFLYLTVKATGIDSVYTWQGSYRYPESTMRQAILSIPEVQGTSEQSPKTGQEVTIAGRVTANFDYSFYLETNEETLAGINVYNTLFRGKIGDSILVRGTVEEFNNLTEIGQVDYIYNFKNNQEMTPKIITTADIGEQYEGMLVSVHQVMFDERGRTIPDSNSQYTFNDAKGSAKMYISNSSRLIGESIPTGFVNITGILSQYQDSYQLLPRDKNDFYLLTDNAEMNKAPEIATIYPNPVQNELFLKTQLKIKKIEIYNLNGQLLEAIQHPTNQINTSALQTGIYLIDLTFQNQQTQKLKFVKAN